MNLLVLLEDDNYQSLSEKLSNNPRINTEVSNIDFNLTTSINRAQIILFFGSESDYQNFISEYQTLLTPKLIIRTCPSANQIAVSEVQMHISSGVGVCEVAADAPELANVIYESLQTIFDNSLKLIMTSPDNYLLVVAQIANLEAQLLKLASDNIISLGDVIVKQVFTNFEIK